PAADSALRRGDELARHRVRAGPEGEPGRSVGEPYVVCNRAPAEHDPRRRPHRRPRARPPRRAGDARRAHGLPGPVLLPGEPAARALDVGRTSRPGARSELRVDPLHVVVDHACGREARRTGDESVLDPLAPDARDTVLALVEHRHDLTFEQLVEARRVAGVRSPVIGVLLTGDGPTVEPVVGLGPPA